jgi:hypothetical protein
MTDEAVELHELFNPKSIEDRWVFLLSETVSDLAIAESVFKDALHGEHSHPAHRFYLQRQLSARIVEADRVVLAIRGNRKVEEFIERIGAKDEADWLVARFAKRNSGESEIDATLREGRHRTVHHAKLNSPELMATLELARDEAVRIERDNGKGREIIEFPESVLTRYIFAGEGGKLDERLLKERATLIEEVLDHFAKLWQIAWPALVRAKGVDPAHLYRIVGNEAPPDQEQGEVN